MPRRVRILKPYLFIGAVSRFAVLEILHQVVGAQTHTPDLLKGQRAHDAAGRAVSGGTSVASCYSSNSVTCAHPAGYGYAFRTHQAYPRAYDTF